MTNAKRTLLEIALGSGVKEFVHPSIAEYRARTPQPERREGGRRTHGEPPRRPDTTLPLVSVVTAVLDSEAYLERCIESVLSQTYPNVEYVLVDGGSKDRSVEIIRRFEGEIDYWMSERDQSPFDGMNRGIAASTGALVKIHGADDIMPPRSAELAVERYLEHEAQADRLVIRGDMEIIDENGRSMRVCKPVSQFRFMPPVLHPTWYVPMACYERFGLYDPGVRVGGDYELTFFLAEHGVRFEHIDEVLTQFRTGGLSTAAFTGFTEGFRINRRYLGLPIALYLVSIAGVRRTARLLLEKTMGRDRLATARRQAYIRSARHDGR